MSLVVGKDGLVSISAMRGRLKGLFHRACLARAVSWFAIVAAIFMAHENGDNKGKPRGMLGETDSLNVKSSCILSL